MPFTDYLDAALVKHAFGGPIWTPPATLYVGLSSSAPTQQAGGGGNYNFTEPAIGTNGYARAGLAYNTTNFVPVASEPLAGYQITIGVLLAFAMSTGAWLSGVSLGWFGIFDAATAGNLLEYGPLTPPLQVTGAGYIPEFPANQLTTSLT